MFMMFRSALFVYFGDFTELAAYKLDVINAFIVGAKFDTSVIAYAFLPIFFYTLVFSAFYTKNNKRGYYYYSKINRIYLTLVSMLLLLVSIVDYFFYSYFQTHISPVIFGLKNDKTEAILISMWTDYPVITVLVIIVLFFLVFVKAFKHLYRKLLNTTISFKKYNPLLVLLTLGIFFIGIRGSLGMFPLRLDHTTISTNSFVNELVLNGPFALRIANGLQKETLQIHLDRKKTLQEGGFSYESEVLNWYLNTKNPKSTNIKESLTVTTKKNSLLETRPPNVVFVLVESLSNHYLDLHSKELNLLGELDNELSNCLVFRNFLSAKNLTVKTLESILLGTPKAPISQSSFAHIKLNSSIANPFKKAGYQTTYLTGDQLGWRNTGRFIKKQNFDKVQGFSFLEKKYTNPEYFAWGVHDEYLYQHMFDLLNESKNPQFIFTLTVSNHTPYDLPKQAVIPIQKISDSLAKLLIPSTGLSLKNFASYYYSANELGKFIKKVRNSPLGANTIIIATGDHNERGMFNYSTSELFLKRSVPLILYIPKAYKPLFIDENRFGSHKDIFPTIFNLALSKTDYIKTGNDLFSTVETDFFAENDHITGGNKYGVINHKNGKVNYYKWKDTTQFKGLIQTSITASPELLKLNRKMEAHKAAMMLNFQNDVLSQKKTK